MNAADGFAARMRGLKERSGLSYGALAKRLHVSTSTLHRYCNGDAVPTGFAPVERLGRLCGATREELVELHRAWILADEARRRPPATVPAPEPVPVPQPQLPSEPEPESHLPSEPEPEPLVEIQTRSAAEVPAAPPEVLSGGRSRRRVVTVAAGAVVAAALAVPAVHYLGFLGRGLGTPRAAGDDAPAGPPAPLSAGISSYNWAAPCGQYYVLDQDPEHVPPPPAPQDTRGWARALDGIDGGHMQLQLTVTGGTQESVLITDLHVRVVERGEPLDRTAYSMGDGCGSGVTPQTFDVDLDAPRPYLKPVAGQDGDRVVPAKDFPYKVATGDPQVLNLDVHTEQHAATWYLELDWSSGARHGTVRVDDGGRPFRTSAIEGRATYGYWAEKGTWTKQ